MTIGEATKLRIWELCAQRDLSVTDLSAKCGLAQSTINNIVNGRNKSATIVTVKKICDGLGISIVEFFDNNIFEGLEQEIK